MVAASFLGLLWAFSDFSGPPSLRTHHHRAAMGDQGDAPAGPASYDLTFRVSKFLDRHLVFPLLEFLSQKQLYSAAEIEAAKLELIEKTNMVDYAVDIYQGLNQTNEVRGRAEARGAAGWGCPPAWGRRSAGSGAASGDGPRAR